MAFQKPPTICPICKQGRQFKAAKDFYNNGQEYSLYECLECKVQFWLPQKAVGDTWYEKNNPYQVRSLDQVKVSRGYHKEFLKINKSFSQGTKVLDLGCGTGEFIYELKKRGCDVYGVDFDRNAIEIAKNKLGLDNVYQLSFEEFFKKQDLPKFDIITIFEVIEHLTDPIAFMGNVKSLLREDGKIIISTPCRERLLPNLNNWDFPPHHFTRWNYEAISNIFSMVGLNLSDIFYVEQLKILSETVTGGLKTGLVSMLLNKPGSGAISVVISRIIYMLGRVKNLLLGSLPAFILFLLSKLTGQKNGIIMAELRGSKKPKKVFLLATSLEMGGMERVISDLALNLPINIDRTVVLVRRQVKLPYDFGEKVACLDLPDGNNIFNLIKSIFRLKKLIKREKPDYIVSFGFHANILNVLSFKQSIVRADTCLSAAHGKIGRFLIKNIYSRALKINCVSFGVAKDLMDNLRIKKEKIKVIYNPLDIKKIVSLSSDHIEEKYKYVFNSPVIINVGRLEKQKGQEFLLRVFKDVKNRVNNVKLVFLGSGELETELREMAKDLKLEDSVYFLGWRENPFKFLSKAKIFVSSSLREGLPSSILEAMACGLPIVSLDCEFGPREILAPKTDISKNAIGIEYGEFGTLVQVSNCEKFLGDAVVEVLNDKMLAEKWSNKSLQRVSDFDVSKIIKEWDFLGK